MISFQTTLLFLFWVPVQETGLKPVLVFFVLVDPFQVDPAFTFDSFSPPIDFFVCGCVGLVVRRVVAEICVKSFFFLRISFKGWNPFQSNIFSQMHRCCNILNIDMTSRKFRQILTPILSSLSSVVTKSLTPLKTVMDNL